MFAAVNLKITGLVALFTSSATFASSPSKEGFSEQPNDSAGKNLHMSFSKPEFPHTPPLPWPNKHVGCR